MKKQRIAIFASGTGSNAMNLIRHFRGHNSVEIAFVLSNRADAPVLDAAKAQVVEVVALNNTEAADENLLRELCRSNAIDWIVLAGYLRLVPGGLIRQFSGRIINLHPSLLPAYGGRGMYGRRVHEAVIANRETESGITIHFVNEEFDKGQKIAQFYCTLNADDTVDTLEKKIRQLEQSYLPVVVEKTVLNT